MKPFSDQLSGLIDSIHMTSKIVCERCGKDDEIDLDEYDAANYYYRKGWRVLRDKTLCRGCTRIKNQINTGDVVYCTDEDQLYIVSFTDTDGNVYMRDAKSIISCTHKSRVALISEGDFAQ